MAKTITDRNQLAENAHRTGNFAEAVRLQREEIERIDRAGEPGVDARKRLCLYLYSGGRYEEALAELQEVGKLAPNDVEPVENSGVILRMLGRKEEAIVALRRAHELDPKRANVCDALAHCYANLGNEEEAQRFGRLSLELKDLEASLRKPVVSIPNGRPPGLQFGGAKKNVISFSLWGDNPRYLRGAIRNAQAAVDIYPGWIVRFYCDDSVPAAIRSRLAEYGAEVLMRPRPKTFFDGLLWRFEVVADSGVGRFLIRDCDSVVNVKERVAVDEWVSSKKWFHAMRDFASHTEVILAGMWGGVAGVLPSVPKLRAAFRPSTAPTRTYDQVLLREVVWPVVRNSVLVHDSVYTGCLESVPFPEAGTLPPGIHIGQNEAAVRPHLFVPMPEAENAGNVFFLSGIDEEAVESVRKFLGGVEGIEIVSNPTIPEIRSVAEQFLTSLGADPTNLGQTEEIALSGVRAVVEQCPEGSTVGVCDPEGTVAFAAGLARMEGGKILCVVRDPRDTASARRISSPEQALQLARDWNRFLSDVAAANQRQRKSVELVRYEDLSAEKSVASLRRVLHFLGSGVPASETADFDPIDSGKPLPTEIAAVIEQEARTLMERLHYLPSAKGRVVAVSKQANL